MSLLQSFRAYLKNRQITIQSESNEQRISFERGGLNYVFYSNLKDPLYFRIMLPRIDHVNSVEHSIFGRLNYLTMSYKAGKAVLIDNDVWLTFEQFVDDADADHNSIFDRGFSILSDMLEEYKVLLGGNQPEEDNETVPATPDMPDA